MSVTNDDAETALRQWLKTNGYSVSRPRVYGENGVDIVARRGREALYIEVIGYSAKPSKRARDFFEAFFRAVSRLKEGANCCIIAMPEEYGRGLRQRAAQYDIAWKRIGIAFPELSIWLVNCAATVCSLQTSRWNDWL
jgi:Holliday junction resolvase-like predicted endonuclease